MAKFRPFILDDLFFINLRDYERHLFRDTKDCALQLARQAEKGEAYTCEYKGKILFFYTIIEEHGNATLSLVAGAAADEHPVPFGRASGEEIEALAKKYKRLDATVHVDYEKSVKWLEAMGFEIEGVLKKYGPTGDDYYMMARTT
jgi:L-amino acid N-acyltransferase YncA